MADRGRGFEGSMEKRSPWSWHVLFSKSRSVIGILICEGSPLRMERLHEFIILTRDIHHCSRLQ
jgi:hypothetical protein